MSNHKRRRSGKALEWFARFLELAAYINDPLVALFVSLLIGVAALIWLGPRLVDWAMKRMERLVKR